MQLYDAQGNPLDVSAMRSILAAYSAGDENAPRVYTADGDALGTGAGNPAKTAINQALSDAGFDEGGQSARGPNGEYFIPLDDPQKIAQAQQLGVLQYINGVPVANYNDPNLRGGIGSGALFADMPQENTLATIAPVLLAAAGGSLAGLSGLGGAAGDAASSGLVSGGVGSGVGGGAGAVVGSSGIYDPALIDAAYSGMGSTGIGSTAAGLGTSGGAGLLTSASQLPVDAAMAGGAGIAGAAGSGFSAQQLADAASGATNGVNGPPPSTSVIGQTPLGRLLGLGQTGSDLLSVLGPVAGAGLGLLGSQQQADAYKDVAAQQAAIGAPYRDQLLASYQPGFNLASQPGYGDAFGRIADISSRAYSASAGNPADNPTAQAGILSDVWNQGYLPALTNYRGQLGQFGGLGLNTSGQASLAGASQAGGGANAVGYGLGSITQPQNDIASLLKQLGGTNQGLSLNVGGIKA